MGAVARPPNPIRDLLGLDPRLRNSLIHTGGRRWGPQAPWNYFGGAGQPALISPWSPYTSTGAHAPRWYRDEENTVHFSGLAQKTSSQAGNSPLFYMPAGLRPTQYVRWLVAQSAQVAYGFTVQYAVLYADHTNGGVFLVAPFANPSIHQWISLDGLSYSLD